MVLRNAKAESCKGKRGQASVIGDQWSVSGNGWIGHDQEHEHEKSEQATTFETNFSLVVSIGSERQDLLCL